MKLMVVIPPKKASNVDCSAVLSQLDQQILQNTHEIRVFLRDYTQKRLPNPLKAADLRNDSSTAVPFFRNRYQ